MKNLVLFVCLLFCLLTSYNINAQSDFGAHPNSVIWNCINTENVRVIFPAGQEARAYRIANIINSIAQNNVESIGLKKKKVDLVLQTNQVYANGYVALTPFRSEFFATSFQNGNILGSINWLDVLSIHEYRHVQQLVNANRGLTKVGHILQGQAGWQLLHALSIPNWFSEGDATMTETVLSSAGRGRTPSFFKEQRATLLNEKDYLYQKARNGSFKSLLPNHYPMGYSMVNYARNNYSQNVWADVLADAGRYKRVLYPFAGALKKHTGIGTVKLYQNTNNELKQQWEEELKTLKLTSQKPLTQKPKRTVTNYRFASYLADGSIIAVKSAFNATEMLVHIANGEEQYLTSIGIEPEGYLTENNGKVAWTEVKTDIRRANLNYTVVMTYNLATKQKKMLTDKSKYFSPHFSNDGSKIIVVATDENTNYQLVVLDANTGAVIQKIANTSNHFLALPKWTADGTSVVAVTKRNSQVALIKYDIAKGTSTKLTDWSTQVIGNFNISNDKVYFNGGYSGIDNIYSVSLNGDKNITQITSARIGAYMPDISPDGNKLVMSEFTEMGYMLTELNLSDAINKPIELVEPVDMARYNILLSDTEGDILNAIPLDTHEVKAYKGLLKGTKLHSWNLGGAVVAPGVNLKFNNILNDFSSTAFLGYNFNEDAFQYGASISYAKFFPIVSISNQVLSRNLTDVNYQFDERIIKAGVSVPLRWINGNYSNKLDIATNLGYHEITDSWSFPKPGLNFSVADFGFSFSNLHRKAKQHVQPRFGRTLSAHIYKSLNNEAIENIQASTAIYLPGIGANHGIKLEAAYKKENRGNDYRFIDDFQYVRGYTSPRADEVARFSINYQLPLLYPDLGIAGIIYFKRIRANVFFDASQSSNKNSEEVFNRSSFGAELILDNVYLNLLPLGVGIRGLYYDYSPWKRRKKEVQFFIAVDL